MEKKLQQEIIVKKKEALDKAGGNKALMDFDINRDVYGKICREEVTNYMFELDINHAVLNVPKEEMTPEKLADLEFKNYVYEAAF